MEKELGPEVIKLTQNSLGKYVKRPPLTEKLLKKPPFRFLHDVITTVLKTTGFFENLFEEEELNSENVKDRDSKILFLTKVIFVLSSATGKTLSAKPSKIVAGQEPEKTNELLQCLAQALDNKLSSDNSVKQYKESINFSQNDSKTKEPSKPLKKTSDTKKVISKSNEKPANQKNDVTKLTTKQEKEKSNDIKSKKKENVSNRNENQPKTTQQSKTVAKKKETKESQKEDSKRAPQSATSNKVEKEKSIAVDNETISILSPNSEVSEKPVEREHRFDDKSSVLEAISTIKQEILEKNITPITTAINFNDLNSSASSNDSIETADKTEHKSSDANNVKEISQIEVKQQHKKDMLMEKERVNGPINNLEVDTTNSDKSKPNSGVTKMDLEYKTVNIDKGDLLNEIKVPISNGNDTKATAPPNLRPVSVRPSSSRPGAPRMREKVDNIIKDTDNLLMGKVNIIVENTNNEEEEETSLIIVDQTETNKETKEHQELQLSSNEHGHLVQQILDSQKELSQISGKTDIEWQFGAQKAREAMNQDVEQLRFNIQALSRVANPLGKLMDHIQEDVEVMRQELQQWTNIYNDVNKEMLKQKTLNEDSLLPFHTKSKQLENDIEEKHDKINDLKVLIHKNAIRIEKLLTSGNVQ